MDLPGPDNERGGDQRSTNLRQRIVFQSFEETLAAKFRLQHHVRATGSQRADDGGLRARSQHCQRGRRMRGIDHGQHPAFADQIEWIVTEHLAHQDQWRGRCRTRRHRHLHERRRSAGTRRTDALVATLPRQERRPMTTDFSQQNNQSDLRLLATITKPNKPEPSR